MSTLILLHLVLAGLLLGADLISVLVLLGLHPADRLPSGLAEDAQAFRPKTCAGCSVS